MKKAHKIFNRVKMISNKNMALKLSTPKTLENSLDFYKIPTQTICDQLSSIRKNFTRVAILGSYPHLIMENLPSNVMPENIFLCDKTHEQVLKNLELFEKSANASKFKNVKIYPMVIDEEFLCFKPEVLDLVIACHNLHFVNDLEVCLLRILESLVPDGAFIGCIHGEDTLEELRIALTLAENERCGGISQHVAPFISVTELGNLFTRCSFNMPTIYSERKDYYFHSSLHLMTFLQNLGENNCLLNIRHPFSLNQTIYSAMAIYDNLFEIEKESNNQNRIVRSTFEDIYFLGWKYHESQQKPKKKGSATFSLKDLSKEIGEIDKEVEKKIRYGEIGEEEEENDKNNIKK